MIGNIFVRKSENLMHTETDFRIAVRDVEWRTLRTTDDKIDLVWKHWSITWPTYARGRVIVLDGYIIAKTREDTSKGMDWLDGLFWLQWVPGSLELYELAITDEQSREFAIQCKVDTPLQYDIEEDNDHNDGSRRRWRVTLFAPDPRFFSTAPTTETGIEWFYWGLAIDNTGVAINIGLPLNAYGNEIEITGRVWVDEPVKITIEATNTINTPLTVYNASKGTYFSLDISGVSGDIFIIDTKNTVVTKNGTSIIGNRIPWSSRPVANGVTNFIIYDIDQWLTSSDCDVEIEYTATIL